jgi:hypothetical protein
MIRKRQVVYQRIIISGQNFIESYGVTLNKEEISDSSFASFEQIFTE